MRALALVFLAAAACGGDDAPPPGDRPTAPSQNDPDFDLDLREWYLVGNDHTPGGDTYQATITAPAGTGFVDAWIGDRAGVRLTEEGGRFVLSADIADLEVGTHDVLFAADGAATAFARVDLHRSHPYYVLVTTDWDFSDPGQDAMDFHDEMHEQHPGVLITHFIGPYTFTDPDLPDAREAEIVAWAQRLRDDFGDEIGLHIHPYCHFVEHAGVTCNTAESTVYADDTSGYTIGLWAYGDTDFRTLLEAADLLFMERDLGKPVTFRAGGWTATIDTLRALAATGYVADTSANNWARMEEWIPDPPFVTGILYSWNMEHWATIDDTSQPYYPNDTDVLSPEDPTLSILEVPDNAIMVDYVSLEEMTDIFEQNWDGTPLATPTTLTMGWHPSASFSEQEKQRVDGLLDLADLHLASEGDGPVVYTNLRDMPAVFTR